MKIPLFWLVVGFVGQALFSMRFFLQWWTSERAGKSVIPIGFWYFSLAGSVVLLVYAIYKRDPVFIIGQAGGLVIYLRNLSLISRERQGGSSAAAS